jgi:hypothetical protein
VKRSTTKILTTHVGSLPELASLDRAAADYSQKLRQQVAAVVQKQREIGLDVINDGEYARRAIGSPTSRSGFGFRAAAAEGRQADAAAGKDREGSPISTATPASAARCSTRPARRSNRRARIGPARRRSPIAGGRARARSKSVAPSFHPPIRS